MDVDEVIENVLAHHGVKGMRWGFRRSPEAKAARAEKKLAKADTKWEKNIGSTSSFFARHNAMADHFNSHIDAINNKPEYKDKNLYDHPDLMAKYDKEVETLTATSYHHAVQSVHGTSPSGKKKAVFDNENNTIHVVDADTKHAASDDMSFSFTRDKNGFIVSIKPAAMAQGALAVSDILEHHGVKGMHWGVRRERSQDVTVTTKRKNKAKAKGGQDLPIHKDAIKKVEVAQIKKKSGINALSDSELKAYANRLQLEANVSRLESEQKSAGSKWIRKFLKDSGNQTENTFVNETSQAVGKSLGKAAVRRGTKVAVKTGVKAALG